MKQFIVPAILPQSLGHLHDCLHRVEGIVSYVQIDIVDGVYAENVSWPFSEGGDVSDAVRELGNIRVVFELDLMVSNPEETLAVWLKSGVRRYVIHLSSTRHIERCIDQIRGADREVYIGVVIDDNLADLERIIGLIDGVQCMGIAHIGKQGEPYDPRVEDVVRAVSAMRPKMPIVVDGGVSKHCIPALMSAGVSCVAVGSALFTGDVTENFSDLVEAVG